MNEIRTKTQTTSQPRNRKLKLILLALSFGVMVSFVCGELIFRVIGYSPEFVNPSGSFHQHDPELGFIGKPKFSGIFHTTDFNIPVSYNQHGFRHTHKQNSSTERTLYILGDSYGWGWGVKPGKSISDYIATEFPNWNVINYSLPGYGTLQQKMVFDRFVQANLKNDDAVMILHFGNDFDDNVRKTADNAPHAYLSETGEVNISLPPPERWSSGLKQKLKDTSYFYNYLAYVINYQKRLSNHRKEETKLTKQKEKSKEDPTMIQDDPRITVMEYLLSEIQSECRNKRSAIVDGSSSLPE